MTRLFLILFALFFCVGCSSTLQKQSKLLSKTVYAAQEAANKGRFDLSKKYLDEAVKLTPPPKDKIKVNEFKIQKWNTTGGVLGKKELISETSYAVLPENTDVKNIIVNGAPDYNKIVADTPALLKSEKENVAQLKIQEKKIEEIQREKEKIVEKAEEKSLFGSIKGWFFGLGISGILVLIVIAIFFPALLPLIFSVLKTVFGFIVKGINEIIEWVRLRVNKGS